MERENPRRRGRHRREDPLRPRRRSDGPPSREVEREDPTGKTFIMVNAGHAGQDTPMIPDAIRLAEGQLVHLPPDKKLYMFIENFAGDAATTRRINTLISQGMTLSQAEVQIKFERMSPKERGRTSTKQAETRARIREDLFHDGAPFEAEMTFAIDNLLSQFPRRVVIGVEAQPEDVYEANKRFFEEFTGHFPKHMPDAERVALRREQIMRWAEAQARREENIANQIIDGMSRKDVAVGIGFEGAWHYGGVDKRIREALTPPDDPQARNVSSVFPESELAVEERGEAVRYPVDPTLSLMRDVIEGREISDLDILLAIQVDEIDFSGGQTAEQIIAEQSVRFDPESFVTEVPTETMSAISPQGEGARQAREKQKWVALQRNLISETTSLQAIQREADRQLQEELEQSQDDNGGSVELRVGGSQIDVPVTPPDHTEGAFTLQDSTEELPEVSRNKTTEIEIVTFNGETTELFRQDTDRDQSHDPHDDHRDER
jgi:hypothetical protein